MRLGNDMLWALIVMISRTFSPIGPGLIGHGPDLSYILVYWTELIDPGPVIFCKPHSISVNLMYLDRKGSVGL